PFPHLALRRHVAGWALAGPGRHPAGLPPPMPIPSGQGSAPRSASASARSLPDIAPDIRPAYRHRAEDCRRQPVMTSPFPAPDGIAPEPGTLVFGDCELDRQRRELRRAGDIVALEPKVF